MGMIAAALFMLSCALCAGFYCYFAKTMPPVFIHAEDSAHDSLSRIDSIDNAPVVG